MDATLNGPFGQRTLSPAGLTIGRVPDNELVISDPKSSSRHAEIRASADGYILVDLGSTNGTFVNDQRLERNIPRPLYNGDVIRIGDTTFSYSAPVSSGIEPTVFAGPGSNPPMDATVAAPPPSYPDYPPPQAPQPGFNPQPAYGQPPAQSVPPFQSFPQAPQIPSYQPAPGYIQPGQYGSPPQKPKKTWLWVTLSIVGVVLLLACSICGFFVFVASADSPDKALTRFCDDIVAKDFTKAYDEETSTTFQGKFPRNAFVQGFSQAKITKCTHSSAQENGNNASAQLIIETEESKKADGTLVQLKKGSNNSWKIDDIPAITRQLPQF